MDEDIRSHLDRARYRDAFELLVDRYQRKAFHLAYSVLEDESVAEETVQEVFLQIWKVLPGFRGEASLSTWIYAITRNRSLTQRKKLRAHLAHSIEEPIVRVAAEAYRSEASAEHRTGMPDAAELLARVSPPYRDALRLFYLEEKSYQEVASMLGLPVGTVKTHLHRARKQLAESLAKAGVGI